MTARALTVALALVCCGCSERHVTICVALVVAFAAVMCMTYIAERRK